jgi:ubiquinone/menaquinone biosynthesis C-methylase UbiE
VRTTDIEPIEFIANILRSLPEVWAADIGCGDGRYDLLLFKHIPNLHLSCIDINDSMLKEVRKYLKSNKFTNFQTIKANADETVPLEPNSMDCILTFNAIHHFNFVRFINNASVCVKKDGNIFIYTRLRSQNARSIWGKYFPDFVKKETRLYELDELERMIKTVMDVRLEAIKTFQYKRHATLRQLVEKVRARHYSTFSLYTAPELDDSIGVFKENIKKNFNNTGKIEWVDENILLVLVKC